MALCVVAGVLIGAVTGWSSHGFGGAIGVGLISLFIGGIFGAAPSLLLEFHK